LDNQIIPQDCRWCNDALYYLSIIGSVLSSFFLLLSLVTFCQIEINRRLRKSKNIQQHAGMHYHYDKLLITLTLNLFLFNIFYIIFTAQSNNNFPNIENTTDLSSIKDSKTKNNINWCESIGILLHFLLISSFFLMTSMAILRYLLLLKSFVNIRRFNLIVITSSYLLSSIIIFVTAFTSTGPTKYLNINRKM
jgi:hypothetical protein